LFLAEKIVACALGVESCVIEESAHSRVAAFAAKNIQLFFRADEVTGKTEQFEKKGSALGVGGIVAHFGVQSLNGVIESSRLK
jgi:hypothetical protein